MSVIDEPTAAIAAGRCLTARSVARRAGDEWTNQHPRRCAWCDYPTDALTRLVDGFNQWAGAKDVDGRRVYGRYDVQAFAEQARRQPELTEAAIVAAQGLIEEAGGGGTHRVEAGPPQPSPSISPGEAPDAVFSVTVDPELEAWS